MSVNTCYHCLRSFFTNNPMNGPVILPSGQFLISITEDHGKQFHLPHPFTSFETAIDEILPESITIALNRDCCTKKINYG